MATAHKGRKFTDEEAERFAALLAGFDVCNPNDAEASAKGKALRRMVAGKTLDDGKPLRIVDAWELEEIREAIDRQLLPVRAVRIVTEGCQRDPWPVRMLWLLAAIITWCAEGVVVIVVVVGAFMIGCAASCISGLWKALWSKDTWKSG